MQQEALAPPLVLQEGQLEAAYRSMANARQTHLDMARDCSVLTLPRLLPPDGYYGQRLPVPYQGIGARGVNNLASKLLLTLFSPNAPFFAVEMTQVATDEVKKTDPKAIAQIKEKLINFAKEFTAEFEALGWRPDLIHALKHAIVGGTCLLSVSPKDKLTVRGLDTFVISTNPETKEILKLILCDKVRTSTLPKAIIAEILKRPDKNATDEYKTLYTGVELRDGSYKVWQEVDGLAVVTDTAKPGTYSKIELPYFPLAVSSSHPDYPSGHVEELLGYLQSLEGLTQAVVEGSAAMSRGLILVNPNGTTRRDQVQGAGNWAVIDGNKDDVSSFQLEKAHDLSVASNSAQAIEKSLAFAFLMNSAVQRDAERLTAEEIRTMIQELDDSLGGIHSTISERFQRPLIDFLRHRFQKQGKLMKLPETSGIRYRYLTGMDALGRGHEFQRLSTILNVVGKAAPNALSMFNMRNVVSRFVITGGVDPEGLIYTEQELAQQQQQQQAMAMAQSVAPQVAKSMGEAALANQQPQQ